MRCLKLISVTAGLLAVLGLASWGAFGLPGDTGPGVDSEWVYAHDDKYCKQMNPNWICAEWCIVGGTGSGTYCCIEQQDLGSDRLAACQELRH